jgi:glycosyltransferase involved in cell wall biosynthesis
MAYLRRWWAGCAAVIAPSSDLAGEIAARLPAGRGDRVRVIPTGVDVAAIRAVAPIDVRPVAGWPSDAVVVASLGRLAAEKDPGVVLDAFARAVGTQHTARLLVIGGGPLEREVRERAVSPPLAGRILVSGRLDRTDALARLAAADLFCFASRTETQGLVLAEALTAGLPAVAIDGPGVRDSVRDGADGIVVDAEPARSRAARLGDALAELVADAPRRRAMASRARDGADRFAVERRVAETEELYRAVRS